jgi:adenosylcobyric acid synthase
VRGTSWHGVFENDRFRRAFLTELAARTGRRFLAAPDTSFEALRQARIDVLADAVEEHLDTDTILSLIGNGTPASLPTVRTSLG